LTSFPVQAQLSQTLVTHEHYIPRASNQPCNTPTSYTSSASFSSWGYHPRRRHSNARSDGSWHDKDEVDEDERMVEDLLLPPSPTSSTTQPQPFSFSQHQTPFTFSSHTSQPTSAPAYSCAAEASNSLFTSTDPFYIAQSQASQNFNSPSSSFLAQAGLPAQHSPFLIHHHQHSHFQIPHCEGGYISGAAVSIGRQSHS
jgi:hypothetical protein